MKTRETDLVSDVSTASGEIGPGDRDSLLTTQRSLIAAGTELGLPRATVDTVRYGALRPAHPGTGREQPRAVVPTARADAEDERDERKVGP